MGRYIDADKFLKDQIRRCGCVPLIGTCTMDNESLKDIVEQTPTADVVEVVRCRNCEKRIGESITGETFCLIHEVSVPYDYYCASGERSDT